MLRIASALWYLSLTWYDCNDFHYKMPLQVVNSEVDPVAYALFKKDIKAELKRVFKKRQ